MAVTGKRTWRCCFSMASWGSGQDWAETVEAFPDYRCILVDLPGHGLSAGCPPGLYPMPQAALALLAVLDGLGVEACVPVGYSMGGRLALYLALTHPDRCRAVVLESGSPGLASELEREARREWDESKATELERQGLAAFLEDWYRQPLFESIGRNEARFAALMERRRHNDPAGFRALPSSHGHRLPSLPLAATPGDTVPVACRSRRAGLSLQKSHAGYGKRVGKGQARDHPGTRATTRISRTPRPSPARCGSFWCPFRDTSVLFIKVRVRRCVEFLLSAGHDGEM